MAPASTTEQRSDRSDTCPQTNHLYPFRIFLPRFRAQFLDRFLGLANISFRNESINEIDYKDEFDYVLCTGVIHHNADHRIPLTKISSALRRYGLLELMVYNRYPRLTFNAIQEATALLSAVELV
jgi:SAM-dependent methyltransferase